MHGQQCFAETNKTNKSNKQDFVSMEEDGRGGEILHNKSLGSVSASTLIGKLIVLMADFLQASLTAICFICKVKACCVSHLSFLKPALNPDEKLLMTKSTVMEAHLAAVVNILKCSDFCKQIKKRLCQRDTFVAYLQDCHQCQDA